MLPSSRPPLSTSAAVSREKMSLHVNTTGPGFRSDSAPRPSPPETRSSSGSRPGQASESLFVPVLSVECPRPCSDVGRVLY